MKTRILLALLFYANLIIAQEYNLLETDESGDPAINGIVDLKSISYAIDESVDSLWFKLEFHTSLPGDLGVVFGIDTDLVLDNGLNWESSNNMDLLPEVVFTINRNFIAPDLLYGFSNNNLEHTSTFGENDSTIIVNMELSKLDEDGRFNLVLGSSTFDCDVNNRSIFDDLPESGYLTIDILSSAIEVQPFFDLDIYPNPVENEFYLKSGNNQEIEAVDIYNSSGILITKLHNIYEKNLSINCADWEKGIYFMTIKCNSKIRLCKVVKI
jgi:hypothetical protein